MILPVSEHDLGVALTRYELETGKVPNLHVIGGLLLAKVAPRDALTVGRAFSESLSSQLLGARTPYAQAVALGVPQPEIIGWLREAIAITEGQAPALVFLDLLP